MAYTLIQDFWLQKVFRQIRHNFNPYHRVLRVTLNIKQLSLFMFSLTGQKMSKNIRKQSINPTCLPPALLTVWW